jgi:hypothetical protein
VTLLGRAPAPSLSAGSYDPRNDRRRQATRPHFHAREASPGGIWSLSHLEGDTASGVLAVCCCPNRALLRLDQLGYPQTGDRQLEFADIVPVGAEVVKLSG